MTAQCGVCGKFIKVASWDTTRLCQAHATLLKDFDDLNLAIFNLQINLSQLEKSEVCRPLYRMRCNLGEIQDRFKHGFPVSEYTTTFEMLGRH